MKKKLKEAFLFEIKYAKNFISKKEFGNAFYHLERAHVLGQMYVIPHTYTHLLMLKVGILKRDLKEILGQLVRIPLGVIGSFVKIVPTGNTGGSDVSAFKKMKISEDLDRVLKDVSDK